MKTLDRSEAMALLRDYTESERLIKHMLAVEANMRAHAERGGHDVDLWGITGLLHDFDYERWPNDARDETGHPYTGIAILRDLGYPEEMLDAILGHAPYANHTRTTPLARTLFAVDELSGLIMAMGYVRPNNLEDLKPKSVRKKLKDKAFAPGVNRDDVRIGIEELAIDENEHFEIAIKAMQGIATDLGF